MLKTKWTHPFPCRRSLKLQEKLMHLRQNWGMESPLQPDNSLHGFTSIFPVFQTESQALHVSHTFYCLVSAIWLNCGVFKASDLPGSGVLFHLTHGQDVGGSSPDPSLPRGWKPGHRVGSGKAPGSMTGGPGDCGHAGWIQLLIPNTFSVILHHVRLLLITLH